MEQLQQSADGDGRRRRDRAGWQRRATAALVAMLLIGGTLAVLSRSDGRPADVRTIARPSPMDRPRGSGHGEPSHETTTTAAGQAALPSATTSTSAAVSGRTADVGVHPDKIVLGNVSTQTLSGAPLNDTNGQTAGARAAIAYQNSIGGVWGRQLELDVRDDQLDLGRNREQTRQLMGSAFALLGAASRYDGGAVDILRASDMPDVTTPFNDSRQALADNIAVEPTLATTAITTTFDWFHSRQQAATGSVGTLYLDSPAGRSSHETHAHAAEAAGWHFTYARAVQATEADFTADILRMRQNGVRAVYLVGLDGNDTARLARGMRQQGFTPEFVLAEGTAAEITPPTPEADGFYFPADTLLLDGQDDVTNAEVRLFRDWFARVAPGRAPDRAAALGWASGRLLFQAMAAAGPLASRSQVLDALRATGPYDDHGLIAPARPGDKAPTTCVLLTQLRDARRTRVEPTAGFRCGGREIR